MKREKGKLISGGALLIVFLLFFFAGAAYPETPTKIKPKKPLMIKEKPKPIAFAQIDHGDVEMSPSVLTIRYDQSVLQINRGSSGTIQILEGSTVGSYDFQTGELSATVQYNLRNKTTKRFRFKVFIRHGNKTTPHPGDIVLFGNQTQAIEQSVRFKASPRALSLSIEGPIGISDDTRILFFNGRLWVRFVPM
jgi:hypothetical protein